MVIPSNRKNEEVFFQDGNNNIRFKKSSDGKSEILKQGNYIKVILETVEFRTGDEKITVIGVMEDIATESEVKKMYENVYTTTNDTIDYEKYVTQTLEQNTE